MPMTDFSWTKGQRVQLHSLVGRADLNGRTGTVTGMKDDGSGRVGVSVDGEQKAFALKASNLTVLDTAAEKAAAAKATEARTAVMRLASSLSGAHKPPEEVWQCRFCRNNLPASSYSQDQWSTLKRNSRRSCTGCDFRIPEQTGVRYTKAVAATTVIQARARGSLVRRGRAAPSSQATAATSGVKRAASKEAAKPGASGDAAPADDAPSPKDLALSGAVALYDQMATLGIAPRALASLRPQLPKLAAFAYERDTNGLVDALNAMGLGSNVPMLQQCAMAIMELVGNAAEVVAATPSTGEAVVKPAPSAAPVAAPAASDVTPQQLADMQAEQARVARAEAQLKQQAAEIAALKAQVKAQSDQGLHEGVLI
jgi:hypothetical protein